MPIIFLKRNKAYNQFIHKGDVHLGVPNVLRYYAADYLRVVFGA